jgi:sodium/hydrogen antiporter
VPDEDMTLGSVIGQQLQIGLGEALAVFGALLIGTAALSGLAHRTVLSISVLGVVAGVVLEATGILRIDPAAHAIVVVVEIVLLVTLFSDGLQVEQGIVRRHWRPPARALVMAMPLNATLLAAGALVLFDLRWDEAFLLGFLLSPTDPVITSAVVASRNVPSLVRQTLNLESGLNDGLALPFVLFFLAIAGPGAASAAERAGSLALETAIGVAVGAVLALGAGRLLDRLPDWAITRRYEGLYALGLGLAAFGVADLAHGNGLIAAFCAGVGLAVVRAEVPEVFHRFNEDLGAVLQLAAFALFGALIVETGVTIGALALAAFVAYALFVARPASVLLSFTGVRISRPEKVFIAWFGPKGIASMLFTLFVLNSDVPGRDVIFDVAAFTILASIVAHGLTDTVGAAWIERRLAGAR